MSQMPPVTRGRFVTIEGPEGAGKTTLATGLQSALAGAGRDVVVTREPGGTWLGERIRDVILSRTDSTAATDPLSDALLFNAARRQLVTERIRPALATGTVVICARYADSTLAYQGFGAGLSLARLRDLASLATDDLVPDLTILLDIPVEVGLGRKGPADVTRFEAEFDAAFHRRVRAGFLELAAHEPDRFVVIDANRPAALVLEAALVDVARLTGVGEPKPAPLRTNA